MTIDLHAAAAASDPRPGDFAPYVTSVDLTVDLPDRTVLIGLAGSTITAQKFRDAGVAPDKSPLAGIAAGLETRSTPPEGVALVDGAKVTPTPTEGTGDGEPTEGDAEDDAEARRALDPHPRTAKRPRPQG